MTIPKDSEILRTNSVHLAKGRPNWMKTRGKCWRRGWDSNP